MKNHFKAVCDHLRQASEDIGYGMILPHVHPKVRYYQAFRQVAGTMLLTGGIALDNGFAASLGGGLLGISLGDYQNDGEKIRKALDQQQPCRP